MRKEKMNFAQINNSTSLEPISDDMKTIYCYSTMSLVKLKKKSLEKLKNER